MGLISDLYSDGEANAAARVRALEAERDRLQDELSVVIKNHDALLEDRDRLRAVIAEARRRVFLGAQWANDLADFLDAALSGGGEEG